MIVSTAQRDAGTAGRGHLPTRTRLALSDWAGFSSAALMVRVQQPGQVATLAGEAKSHPAQG